MRRSLRRAAILKGVGLHGGLKATAVIRPAPAGAGIAFRRTDRPGSLLIPALHDRVTDTRLCTLLGEAGGDSVSTVEHLMAALAMLGVNDALIEIDGPEIPILDGSAAPFVEAILEAGLVGRAAPLRAIRILEPVEARHDDKLARLEPGEGFSMSYEISFPDPAIGRQSLDLDLSDGAGLRELADCRTFTRLAEIERLRAMGLARGGSLENAVVVDGALVLNPGGLRRPDEFVRHKMLDAIGDLALAGAPIIGRYVGVKAGHDMTNRLLRALFERPSAWMMEEIAEAEAIPFPALSGREMARAVAFG